MHIIKRCILVAALCATPALASDQPVDPTNTPIDGRYDCRREEAIPVPFLELAKNIEAYAGKCVIMRGMTSGYYFFEGIEDYYRFQNGALRDKRPRVGLYAPSDAARETLFGWRQTVEVVALANTCKHLYAHVHRDDTAERMTITMLTGYCHYTLAPVLHVSEFRILAPGPQRLTGNAARRDFGDSDDLLPSSPIYAEVSSRISAWFDALRRRDIVSLWKQTGHRHGADIGDNEEWPNTVFWDKDTPLRFLFGADRLPPIRYYVTREPPEHPGDYVAYGCICRSADCRGQWPIHSADGSFAPAWPYVCMWVNRSDGKVEVGN